MKNMGPLIFFAIGRIVYSVIERRDKWFLLAEVASSIIFVGLGAVLLEISGNVTRGVSLALVFIIAGLVSRITLPVHPIEAGGESVMQAKLRVPVGIVDFAWLCVMGGTLFFIGFTAGVSPFTDSMPCPGLDTNYYEKSLDTTVFLLGKMIDTMFLLGGVLAVAMGILWAGTIWRKSDDMTRAQYKVTTIVAIKMVVAYLIVALSGLVWIGAPLYSRMIRLLDLLK